MSKMNTLMVGTQRVADLRIVHQKRNFALVDIAVLERLLDQLNEAAFSEIKSRIIKELDNCYNMEQLIDKMADEVAFRRTISGMKLVDIQDLETPEPEKNGKAAASVTLH
jgi:hypothetical protein